MILKKHRIQNDIRFKRIQYDGYSICNKMCIGMNLCSNDIQVACNKMYLRSIKNYSYVYDPKEEGNKR